MSDVVEGKLGTERGFELLGKYDAVALAEMVAARELRIETLEAAIREHKAEVAVLHPTSTVPTDEKLWSVLDAK